jgi:HEXXH motif-containing protein
LGSAIEHPGLKPTSRDLAASRIQKGRVAWAALRQIFERDHALASSLAGRAFLATSAFADAASDDALDRVWSDPSTYYRVRVTSDLYRASQGALPPPPLAAALVAANADVREAFGRALASWQRVALSLAVADARDLELRLPLEVREPTMLPGLDLVLDVTAPTRVAGVRGGVPILDDGSEVPLARCPMVRVGALQVRMAPFAFMVPGYVVGLPGLAFQRERQPLATAAYTLIREILPETFDEMADCCQVLVMKPYHASDFVNQTHSHFPGGAMLSAVPNRYEIADKLVHEWAHDRLFALEDEGAFLHPDERLEEDHYSPWRDDPRPLQGVLHAVYVHLHVLPFWRRVHGPTHAPDVAALARDRLVRYTQQIEIGIHQLEHHARLTARGEALVARMSERAETFGRDVAALGLGLDVAAWIVTVDGDIVRERRADGTGMSVGAALEAHARRSGGEDVMRALASQCA